MTNEPQDLKTFRVAVQARTGIADPRSLGIVGDAVHQRKGGYHEGKDVLEEIGRYHEPPGQHIGSATEDYSARLARDRFGLTNDASAFDLGADWPKGGRAAWLRYNNLLLHEMINNPERLPELRAINVSRDGKELKRFDQQDRHAGLTNSKDSVDTHTHHEFYRDTAGRRQTTLRRLLELIDAAIAKLPAPPAAQNGEDAMMLIRLSPSDGAVFLSNGVTARWVTSEEELADIRTLAAEGRINLPHPEVRAVGRRQLIGRIVGPIPNPTYADLTDTPLPSTM
jgi:hypothetical protein